MKKYKVNITETLSKTVSIEADSVDKALQDVRELYEKADIVLGGDDFTDVDFKIEEE